MKNNEFRFENLGLHETLRNLVSKEVYNNVSDMVEFILTFPEEENTPFTEMDISNYYSTELICVDCEAPVKQIDDNISELVYSIIGQIKNSSIIEKNLVGNQLFDVVSNIVKQLEENICVECVSKAIISEILQYAELWNNHYIENDNQRDLYSYLIVCGDDIAEISQPNTYEGGIPEIVSWYTVSERLGNFLKDKGECVIEQPHLGYYIWGRTTLGQAIYMDTVIFEYAYELNLITGDPDGQ